MWEEKSFASESASVTRVIQMFPDGAGMKRRGGGSSNTRKCNNVIIVAENTDSPLQRFELCALSLYCLFMLFGGVSPLENQDGGVGMRYVYF